MEDEIISSLLFYKEDLTKYQKINKSMDFITAIDNKLVISKNPSMLITKNESLDDYIFRLENSFTNSWCIAYFGLHTISSSIWDKIRDFSKKLNNNLINRPLGRIDIDCFIGRYNSTHTGIHVDHAHNFSFTMRDGKKMYTWDPLHKNINHIKYPEYNKYKNDSIILHNNKDRVCYFPHNYFHVAESPNKTSVVINIALWDKDDKKDNIYTYINQQLSCFVEEKNDINFYSGAVNLDKNFNKIILKINELKIEKILIQSIINQLIRDTSFYIGVPRPRKKFQKKEIFSIEKNSILQWHPLSDSIIFSSNGYCAKIKKSKEIKNLLEDLISEDRITYNNKSEQEKDIIIKLFEWGYLE
ncbi:hypothetical protein IO49_06790 [Gallibacterium anatis]|nr:hypothetical protein IO49_06790 [Gallibacterium anatis]